MSPSDQLADPPDSTCAQVIHPRPEIFCNKQLPLTSNKSCRRQKDFAGKISREEEKDKDKGSLITNLVLEFYENLNLVLDFFALYLTIMPECLARSILFPMFDLDFSCVFKVSTITEKIYPC